MSSKERLLAEVAQLSESELEALQVWLATRKEVIPVKEGTGFFERLRQIHIDAPPDLGVNFDQYRFGEKNAQNSR